MGNLKFGSKTTAGLCQAVIAPMLPHSVCIESHLAGWEHAAIERLLEMSVLHADETSIRVNRKNHWIHSCSFADIVIKKRHPKQGAVQQQPSATFKWQKAKRRSQEPSETSIMSEPAVDVLPRTLLA